MCNTSNPIKVEPVKTTDIRVCKRCGKSLPLNMFRVNGRGYMYICRACEKNETGVSDKFKDFTSRELINELIYRGYRGELKKTVVTTVKL